MRGLAINGSRVSRALLARRPRRLSCVSHQHLAIAAECCVAEIGNAAFALATPPCRQGAISAFSSPAFLTHLRRKDTARLLA